MKAIVRENGSPPTITTPARTNARAGAKALADLLANQEFADMCIITIDWIGDTFTPALRLDTVRWFPHYNGKRLEHHWNISIDDAFSQDNMTNELLRQMVDDLRIEFEEKANAGPPRLN